MALRIPKAPHLPPRRADLPSLHVEREGKVAKFHGSWWRGEHTDFIPSKADLLAEDAVDRYVLRGWTPEHPVLTRAHRITAFGSCFAANVSHHLHQRGYRVTGHDLTLDAHIVRFGEGMVNTFSILQQLEWALEDKEFPDCLWFGKDKEVASLDPRIQEQTKALIESTDAFVLTLGLSEVWYHKPTGEVLWRAVPADLFDDELFGFRVSSVDENLANLHRIHALIRRVRPQAEIVFTLSPVPLMATFRPVPCLTANSVSKAILRVALDLFFEQVGHGDPHCHYFPSYELVKEVAVDPFCDDNRHPRPEVVAWIMRHFERRYCVG
jgi:hypothetical protein